MHQQTKKLLQGYRVREDFFSQVSLVTNDKVKLVIDVSPFPLV